MFLSFKLLRLELRRTGCWKSFLQYQKWLLKVENNNLRIGFLDNCLKSRIIPRFLKFRIPNNGCFDDRSVEDFQVNLLRKEIFKASEEGRTTSHKLDATREKLKQIVPRYCIPSIILHTRYDIRLLRNEQSKNLNKKLKTLSDEQDRPLFNVRNTVICYELDKLPPKYVLETLSLGPKNSVLEKFHQNDVLCELDGLLKHCRDNNVNDELITDINVKTLTYIKNCKKQRSSRNIQMTKKYLKDNELLAVPFDKGIGICLMKINTYNNKMRDIIELPQFKKFTVRRKNGKNPIMKEEERIVTALKTLKNNNKISEALLEKLKPIGSQPPRLYGLAKIHKPDVPLRPVLSMPGSAYYKIANQVAEWLSVVEECKINYSTKSIVDSLRDINLERDHVLVSFDVSSLYTNVPVYEAMEECTNLLYSGSYKKPPVDKETFKELLEMCSCNVIMLTNDGYFQQTEGLAMGSPPAPLLANGWMHKFDNIVKGDGTLFARYMDDYVRDIKDIEVNDKLKEINELHPSLKFTMEVEENGSLPFLDTLLQHNTDGTISSTWYRKKTDTGLVMNYHSLAPEIYKRSVVIGMVHRIIRSCSSWKFIHESLEKAKNILNNNQYPPSFYDPIIAKCIKSFVAPDDDEKENDDTDENDKIQEKMVFLQYRGRVTDKFKYALMKLELPIKVILTLRKLKTVLPSLKPSIEKSFKSGIVYQITCPRCKSRYVGQSVRHLLTRINEHSRKSTPVGSHFQLCNKSTISMDSDVEILDNCNSQRQLLIKEALFINSIKPNLNTKDEYRSHTLVIKI